MADEQKVKTIVSAKGDQKHRLLESIGRDSWVYNGKMQRGRIKTVVGELHVWLFEFEQIADSDVKAVFIDRYARSEGISLTEALLRLKHQTQAFPVSEVSLKEVRHDI